MEIFAGAAGFGLAQVAKSADILGSSGGFFETLDGNTSLRIRLYTYVNSVQYLGSDETVSSTIPSSRDVSKEPDWIGATF